MKKIQNKGVIWRGRVNNYINLPSSRLITIVEHAHRSNKLIYLKGLIAAEMSNTSQLAEA